MTVPTLPKLIFADDHTLFVKTLAKVFKANGYNVIGIAANGKEVLNLLKKETADVIFMDFKMPVMDGIEATKIISKEYPNTKVVMLSMYDNTHLVIEALDVGAKGYLLKNADLIELELAIKEVLKGKTYLPQSIAKNLVEHYRLAKQHKGVELSSLEKQMLPLLEKGLTSKEIASKMEISYFTVNNWRRNMMIKFEVNNVTGLVATARKNGFI